MNGAGAQSWRGMRRFLLPTPPGTEVEKIKARTVAGLRRLEVGASIAVRAWLFLLQPLSQVQLSSVRNLKAIRT